MCTACWNEGCPAKHLLQSELPAGQHPSSMQKPRAGKAHLRRGPCCAAGPAQEPNPRPAPAATWRQPGLGRRAHRVGHRFSMACLHLFTHKLTWQASRQAGRQPAKQLQRQPQCTTCLPACPPTCSAMLRQKAPMAGTCLVQCMKSRDMRYSRRVRPAVQVAVRGQYKRSGACGTAGGCSLRYRWQYEGSARGQGHAVQQGVEWAARQAGRQERCLEL